MYRTLHFACWQSHISSSNAKPNFNLSPESKISEETFCFFSRSRIVSLGFCHRHLRFTIGVRSSVGISCLSTPAAWQNGRGRYKLILPTFIKLSFTDITFLRARGHHPNIKRHTLQTFNWTIGPTHLLNLRAMTTMSKSFRIILSWQ